MPTMEAAPPPLDPVRLRRALVRPAGLWREIEVVSETGSTNADLLQAASAGAAEGAVLAAEAQTAGRGRMGRRWLTRPRAALTFSVLLRPAGVPQSRWGWVPLLAGVAAATALREVAAVEAVLKWPNDVLVLDKKVAGILAEQAGGAIVVGMGINVAAGPSGPTDTAATFIAAESSRKPSREELLTAVLRELEDTYRRWAADPDGHRLLDQYQALCATIGRNIRATLPGGGELTGTATGVDGHGRLIVRTGGMLTTISAGNVVHVR